MTVNRIFLVLLIVSSTFFSCAQGITCEECHGKFINKNYSEAIDCFTKAIDRKVQNSICLLYFRAYSYYYLSDYKKAKEDINSIVDNENVFSVDSFFIGNTYFLSARINSKEGRVSKQIEFLMKALNYIETSDLCTTIAYALIKDKQYQESIKFSTRAIELDSTSAKVYNNRALAYIKINELQLAEEDIKTALSINPKNPYIYKHRGLLQLLKGKNRQACEDFKEAIKHGYREYGNEADKTEVDNLINKNCK